MCRYLSGTCQRAAVYCAVAVFMSKFKKAPIVAQNNATIGAFFHLNIEELELLYSGGFTMTVENYNYRTSQIMLRNQFLRKYREILCRWTMSVALGNI